MQCNVMNVVKGQWQIRDHALQTAVCGRMISSGLNNDSTDFAIQFIGEDKNNLLVTTNMSKTNTADSKQYWLLLLL